MMKPSSSKAKGRRLQKAVAKAIRRTFNLAKEDCRPAIMGERGSDIKLSRAAAARFPYAVECKNQERLNIWQALEQAESNAGALTPLLVFRRNRTTTYCVVEFQHFLELSRQTDKNPRSVERG